MIDSGAHLFLLLSMMMIIGGATAYFAEKRGRGPLGWFFIGFAFGLFGFLLLFLLPNRAERELEGEVASASEPEEVISLVAPKRSAIAEKAWHYLNKEEKEQRGPISFSALRQAWGEEIVSLESYVWTEGMTEWKPIQDLPLLREELTR